MQSNEKNYEGGEGEERERERERKKKRKSYSIAKYNLVKVHWFITFAKKSKFRTQPPPSLYPQTSNFGLSTPHFETSLSGIQKSPTPGNVRVFIENLKDAINIVTYSLFFANAQCIYCSRMYNKTDRKANRFLQSPFLWTTHATQDISFWPATEFYGPTSPTPKFRTTSPTLNFLTHAKIIWTHATKSSTLKFDPRHHWTHTPTLPTPPTHFEILLNLVYSSLSILKTLGIWWAVFKTLHDTVWKTTFS